MSAAPGASLAARLAAGSFAVTAELTPPLTASAEALLAAAAPLRGRVDALNVTDAAGARVALSSLAAAAILAGAGWETVLQVTCRDRNRIALAGDLLGAAAQGVRNLLVLRGDDPGAGDQPEAKAVFDLDTRGVIALARAMRDAGALPSGRAIEPPPRFFIGTADTPFDPPPGWRPERLAAKVEAGAEFVQTQMCFEAGMVRRYLARLDEAGLSRRPPILIGVAPLVSARSARRMNARLYGVAVPQSVIERLERAGDPAGEGRRLCVELIHALREVPGVAGVHVMAPVGGAEAIARVVEAAGLGPSSGEAPRAARR